MTLATRMKSLPSNYGQSLFMEAVHSLEIASSTPRKSCNKCNYQKAFLDQKVGTARESSCRIPHHPYEPAPIHLIPKEFSTLIFPSIIMSKPRFICTLFISLPAVFLALIPCISAAAPPTINIIQTPTAPGLNGSSNSNPPRLTVQIDTTHRLSLTEYAYREPARNLLAAVVGTTASNFDVYHQRREEFHERGSFEYDN
ncbi:hypothetical protein HO173_002737 [Letharia columbiana]|uniref:Uncharacterized protein n=1 Tax=Letharia columbiana TaxID=112416 RepID=A0A8H6G1S7_9LECA|nr:uncharacterized protein HO173_002737 [Letharia columbiana]KAF6238865.1 hypothetical protein HO173_002737 [Letharia columbiana]